MPNVAPLDRSLASNAFTAYVPTSLGFLQRLREFIPFFSRALQQRSPVAAPARPGNMQPLVSVGAAASGSVLKTVQPARSSTPLQQLPLAMHGEVRGRLRAIFTAVNPTNWDAHGRGNFDVGRDEWDDAFLFGVETPQGDMLTALPESLRSSSLLNAGLDRELTELAARKTPEQWDQTIQTAWEKVTKGMGTKDHHVRFMDWQNKKLLKGFSLPPGDPGRSKPSVGTVVRTLPNSLLDPRTGFAASISVKNSREVQINFGCMGSQGRWFMQGARAVFDRLGWWTPKSYSQASKLTQMVAAHLETINKQLPDDKKLTLSLSGLSMGGALATYAALRNGVPATVINPLRLGIGTRAKIGHKNMAQAKELVTEVVVQGDWVSDNQHAKHIYNRKARLIAGGSPSDGIGQRFMLPSPSYEERLAYADRVWPGDQGESNENWARNFDTHNHPELCLDIIEEAREHERPQA
jgi:hypothetical protein